MRTALIIASGFVLLAAFVFAAKVVRGSSARAALWFIPAWLLAAAVNMAIGVLQAGYGVLEEAPIFVVIFVPPALSAYVLWRRWRTRADPHT